MSDAQLAAAEKPVVNQRPSGSRPICERDVTNLVHAMSVLNPPINEELPGGGKAPVAVHPLGRNPPEAAIIQTSTRIGQAKALLEANVLVGILDS